MNATLLYPEFEVVRNEQRCISCRICERQCANHVHIYDKEHKCMTHDERLCVNCHRCVAFCPTNALKIVKNDCTYRENINWSNQMIKEIYKQSESGGVLLSSMGTPKQLPVLLGSLTAQRFPSHQPADRPFEGTDGDKSISW